jgi:hypothetical protein
MRDGIWNSTECRVLLVLQHLSLLDLSNNRNPIIMLEGVCRVACLSKSCVTTNDYATTTNAIFSLRGAIID